MKNKTGLTIASVVLAALVVGVLVGAWIKHAPPAAGHAASVATVASDSEKSYERAVYAPIHFWPAIESAKGEQCLACHREVLDDKVRPTSPAGVNASASKAWYQQLSTYSGDQDTFHRRHLVTPLAKELMNLNCNTCHRGHEPRDEAPGTSATAIPQSTTDITLRKQVNVETTCLKCHGQMPVQNMGLPSPWPESKAMFGNSCLTCHAAIRTNRHQVSYLKAAAIESAGAKNADVCYGCHGGRAWYRLSYPYPRHAWEGMSPDVPDWAKDRPTESEARFQLPPKK
jgi:nitrate/TMAO reductase-like tetraheme cytochrome c subunit